MKVTLLAHTQFSEDILDEVIEFQSFMGMTTEWGQSDSDRLAEFAGRSCYQSFHKPNPDTRSNRDYLANIVSAGHFSVLEHGSATFYVEGVSRNLTHELIRHRHLSFSELSQRFVDMTVYKPVVPPSVKELLHESLHGVWEEINFEEYNITVNQITNQGYTRKQAREAARYHLPAGMETKIVVTGNHRTWREVIAKRNRPEADAEIQLLAKELLRQLKEVAPNTYQDME